MTITKDIVSKNSQLCNLSVVCNNILLNNVTTLDDMLSDKNTNLAAVNDGNDSTSNIIKVVSKNLSNNVSVFDIPQVTPSTNLVPDDILSHNEATNDAGAINKGGQFDTNVNYDDINNQVDLIEQSPNILAHQELKESDDPISDVTSDNLLPNYLLSATINNTVATPIIDSSCPNSQQLLDRWAIQIAENNMNIQPSSPLEDENTLPDSSNKTSCSLCSKSFKNPRGVNRHIASAHPAEANQRLVNGILKNNKSQEQSQDICDSASTSNNIDDHLQNECKIWLNTLKKVLDNNGDDFNTQTKEFLKFLHNTNKKMPGPIHPAVKFYRLRKEKKNNINSTTFSKSSKT